MKGNLATNWWTPISLRAVITFGWISLLFSVFVCIISMMRGDDHGLNNSLIMILANLILVSIIPEDAPARRVPEKFGLFFSSGTIMIVTSLRHIAYRAESSVGLTIADYWTTSPSLLVGIAAVVASGRSYRWFMGKSTTDEALIGLS